MNAATETAVPAAAAPAAPPAAPAAAGSRMPLAWRIFLLFAVLIVLALGAALAVTWRQGERISQQAVERALGASVEVQREFTQRRLEEAQLKAQLIANDPAFVNYVSNAQGGGLGLGDEDVADAGSIVDLLRERQEQYTFDLGVVLDPDGKLLARTDQSELVDSSLGGDPFVEPVLEELTPVSGFWRDGEKLYQAAIMPMDQNEDLVGFLIVALEVNDALGQRVGKVSGADVAYLVPGAEGPVVVGSSLPPAEVDALRAALLAGAGGIANAVTGGTPVDRADFEIGGRQWATRLAPVDAEGGARLGSMLQLFPSDRATAGYRELTNLVLLVGLVSLLVAIPLSFVIAKATLRPLGDMARAAKAAADGDYDTHIAVGGNDELAQLSQAFESLLSNLREKRDIEGYVGNLSRFLPDPGQDSMVPSFATREPLAPEPADAPPAREQLLLLGLDLRQFAKPLDGKDADAAIGELNERTASLAAVAKRSGGRVLAAAGTRVVLGFSGDDRLLGALQTGREALALDPAVAAALVEGEVMTGTVSAGNSRAPTAVGPATYQLDRLLGESGGGRVLLPRGLGDAAKRILGEGNVGVVQGTLSQKPFYSVAREALGGLPEPAFDEPPEADEGATRAAPALAPASAFAAARSTELLPGQRFGGRYEIMSILGQGGMGVVYKARDLELDDVVALKMLKPAALVDHEHLERLKSEIKLARKITHPNVLRTFDFGESEGRPYVSMEYVRGMTLRYLLKQAGRIPYSAALRIARQLSAGLAAAHEVGVLHRDIKPENLILEQSGNAKLMDFGIARPIARHAPGHTQPGMFVGTPHYAAPEQLAGEEVDHRADIYATGVLLCEMFCGKLPFTGANTMEIYLAQMQAMPIKPSEHWPEIPAALEAIILKCIEKDAANRYQSVQELGAELGKLRA